MSDQISENKVNPTWGKMYVEAKENSSGVIPEEMDNMGYIANETISLRTEDGRVHELEGSGDEILAILRGEPKVTLLFTLIGIENAKKFWKTSEGENGEVNVESLVNNAQHSIRITSKVSGTQTFEIPTANISATPTFGEKEGFKAECEAVVIRSGKTLFTYGIVA